MTGIDIDLWEGMSVAPPEDPFSPDDEAWQQQEEQLRAEVLAARQRQRQAEETERQLTLLRARHAAERLFAEEQAAEAKARAADAARVHDGASGSPPRTRGGVPAPPGRHPRCRITPAYAGRRPSAGRSVPAAADHPRVRGEEARTHRPPLSRSGSPPRTRGGGGGLPDGAQLRRITPAYAGKRPRTTPRW